MSVDAWNSALADVLLPADLNAGRRVRFACDDDALRAAAALIGIRRDQACDRLVADLRAEGLLDDHQGVQPLAADRLRNGSPPGCLAGLALLVLAASRMVSDDRASMREYYARLAEVTGIPLRSSWPNVPGVPELSGRFEDLSAWMAGPESGRRGLLDLPAAHRYVDVPIHQTLLRSGDRVHLGAFFHRAGRLIEAGWDPVHQLRRWGGRHQLSAPLQAIVDHDELRLALAAALRTSLQTWDGVVIDDEGCRVLPGELALHLVPGRVLLSVTVPALDVVTEAEGPEGVCVALAPNVPAAVPNEWLTAAADGPVSVKLDDSRRAAVLPGPIMIFDIGPLGPRGVPAAGEEPVWALTCDEALIGRVDDARRRIGDLPPGWVLLCDVAPSELPAGARDEREDERAVGGANLSGGLPLAPGVWLLDYPPVLVCDLPEPAPVTVNGVSRGDAEPGAVVELDVIAHHPGLHRVYVADRDLTIELAEHGPQDGIGSLSTPADRRSVHLGVRGDVDDGAMQIVGAAVVREDVDDPWEPPLIVRYRAPVDIIDDDGSVRTLGPPAPASWLSHVGLPQQDAWEIPRPARAVWVCVDAASGRFVVCNRVVDIELTNAVLDVAEMHADARVVDRTVGGAAERWRRLVDAALVEERGHAG